jgi:hypothetical protein
MWLSVKRRRFVEGDVEQVGAPDFVDLVSAIAKLCDLYGYPEYGKLPLDEGKARLLELLREYPALVVVDDVDSLDEAGGRAVTEALSRGTFDPSALAVLCETFRREAGRPVPLPVTFGSHVPERDVVPHDLGGYDDDCFRRLAARPRLPSIQGSPRRAPCPRDQESPVAGADRRRARRT